MEERETFNGIDFATGDYLVPPATAQELTSQILGVRRNYKEERELQWYHERGFKKRGPDRRPATDVDPMDLSSSGWGVILPEGAPPVVRDMLLPLLHHRREQATRRVESYFRELVYKTGESKDAFFMRYKVEPGAAHPKQLPYYLLIVGSPEQVPYRFQYLLDMQYAVGRIYFDDPEDYRRYAESVVKVELGQHHVRPEACFFSVRNPHDSATRISEERLVTPLIETLKGKTPEWALRSVMGEQAGKAALRRLLGGDETPAILLTAAHGLGFTKDHPLQEKLQGSIICKEWPGRKQPVQTEHYFSKADIGDDARVHGLIAFLFGCYSAGTPDEDSFPPSAWGQPARPPSKPFMSGLAHRLLSHPNGSALAVIGHVDRSWGFSSGSGHGHGIIHFESCFQQLLEGFPIGLAMDWMNERAAEMSTRLTEVLDEYKEDRFPESDRRSPEQKQLLAGLWKANNDARNFVLLGDPAVRLATGPLIAQTPAIIERRALPGGLHVPTRSHWIHHVDDWLAKIATREPLPGLDPQAAVRALREREEG